MAQYVSSFIEGEPVNTILINQLAVIAYLYIIYSHFVTTVIHNIVAMHRKTNSLRIQACGAGGYHVNTIIQYNFRAIAGSCKLRFVHGIKLYAAYVRFCIILYTNTE